MGSPSTVKLPALLAKFGMTPVTFGGSKNDIIVCLDGRVLGFFSAATAPAACQQLRAMKCRKEDNDVVPVTLEVALVLASTRGTED